MRCDIATVVVCTSITRSVEDTAVAEVNRVEINADLIRLGVYNNITEALVYMDPSPHDCVPTVNSALNYTVTHAVQFNCYTMW